MRWRIHPLRYLLLIFTAHGGLTPLSAQELVRGPYLQRATPTGLVVRWRTDAATDSRLSYGADPAHLSSAADAPALVIDHEVELTGLLPSTTYFYAVGTTSAELAGADSDHVFLTPPTAGNAEATRIWVIGDSGTADAKSRSVFDAYRAFTAGQDTDFWMMLGDNAYFIGTDNQYQAAVFDTYPELLRQAPLWPTFGNHDGESADSATQSGPYYDIFTLPTAAEAGGLPSATEAYYSFDYANIHVIVLDSDESDRLSGSPMLAWLAADLDATDADWVLAIWHHPPYSKGSHDSDVELPLIEMRENVLPLLEAGGVDLVLTGHSHAYERSFLLDSHYGVSSSLVPAMILDAGDGNPETGNPYIKPNLPSSPHQGTVYVVAGSSGRVSQGTFDHPAAAVSLRVLGSVVLDIDGGVLDGRFLSAAGVVEDHFRIVKDDPLFVDGFESGDLAAWTSVDRQGQARIAGIRTSRSSATD